MLRPLLGILLAASISSSFAAPTTLDCQTSTVLDENLKQISEVTDAAVADGECPAPSVSLVNTLCNNVVNEESTEQDDGTQYYLFQDTLKKMSCVSPTLSKEESKKKIKTYWDKYGQNINCNLPEIALNEDYIFRYAIRKNFSLFITTMVKIYQVNVNTKDPEDGLTVIEWCLKERDKFKPTEQIYKQRDNVCKILQSGSSNT